MARALSGVLLLVGLAAVGLGVFDYWLRSDAPGVTIEEPERELPAVTGGQTTVVSFPIRNPTRHTARIVGLVGQGGC